MLSCNNQTYNFLLRVWDARGRLIFSGEEMYSLFFHKEDECILRVQIRCRHKREVPRRKL